MLALWGRGRKIAPVVLLPEEALSELLDIHLAAFGLLHGILDSAVQQALARWVDDYPDPSRLHGSVVASEVRQLSLLGCETPAFWAAGLSAARGPNCSVALSDAHSPVIRIRKHPRVLRTAQTVLVTQAPSETLFGHDAAAAPWDVYVLWHPDLKTGSLREACLAAVAHIDSPARCRIYAKLPLPPAGAVAPAGPPLPPPDATLGGTGFDDFFEGEEGAGGADPA